MRKWLIILGVLLWTSCFDDKGNYDYTDIGEITIEGIETGRWYESFAYSDSLKIPVTITSTRYPGGEEPYTYEWKFIPLNAATMDGETLIDYTVSREKDLNIVPALNAKDYNCFFIVTDTIMGLQEKVDFFVRLKTTTSEGWMILCEENEEARLDWIIPLSEDKERVSRNIWKNNGFKLGKPYGITSAFLLSGSNRFVFTENGTFNIDAEDAHVGEDNDIKWRFGNMPDVVHGAATEIASRRNNRLDLLITREKDLYVRNPQSTGAIYGFPINYTSDGKRFDVAPYFGHKHNVGGYNVSVVIYDETNKRFMEIKDDDKNIPNPLSFTGGTVNFEAETGRDMVYMNYTKDNYTFAVLKDPADGEMYVYGFKLESEGKNTRYYYTKLNRPNKDEITHVAFSSIYRYVFYSTENAVYQFNIETPDEPAKQVLSFPGETISVLKMNRMPGYMAFESWELLRDNQLIVGTTVNDEDESECGVMRTYTVPALMAPLVKHKEYTRLGKIVDIVYRERGK